MLISEGRYGDIPLGHSRNKHALIQCIKLHIGTSRRDASAPPSPDFLGAYYFL